MAYRTRILVVDDHEVIRQGLRSLLEQGTSWTVCGEASNGREAIERALELKPDVVVLDLAMAELNGLEAARRLAKELPRCGLVVLSSHNEEAVVREVVAAGVRAYVLKSQAARELVLAVESVVAGRPFFSGPVAEIVMGALSGKSPSAPPGGSNPDALTTREREVLQLLAEGNSNKDVASKLGLSIKTTATHRTNIMKKLGARSAGDLVRYALRNGLVEP